ncbi:MAG: class I SAM-dependent methyltransferase [Emcibacter sp.]|nr:class I SAM-dependent methyltransferase [Emcibacter sp.]
MIKNTLLYTIAHEITGGTFQERIPEFIPDENSENLELIRQELTSTPLKDTSSALYDDQMADDYISNVTGDGTMAAFYRYHAARISQVIQGCTHVVDLCCGPAEQLSIVATLNPDIQFTGIDLSPAMAFEAQQRIASLGLKNVIIKVGNVKNLKSILPLTTDNTEDQFESLEDATIEGVISTMALHHLYTEEDLALAMQEISRIMKPQAALYIVDFCRMKFKSSIDFFADMSAAHQTQEFNDEYRNSMHAAFNYKTFADFTEKFLPGHVKIYTTRPVPMLNIIKSEDKTLPLEKLKKIHNMTKDIKPEFMKQVNDARMCLRIGGLKNDPLSLARSIK